MKHTPQSQSHVDAFDRLLLSIPEIHDVRDRYQAVAGRPAPDRIAWLRENAPETLVSELRGGCLIPELGLDEPDLVYPLLDAMLSARGDEDSPGIVRGLLGPSVVRQELPNGVPYLVTVIHQFTDLEELFEEIRREYQQAFPPVRVRPSTIDDLAFVMPFFAEKKPMAKIAWELVYRDYPHVRALDAAQRKAEYGDLHKKAYARVRWLKSKAIERVNELIPQDSQDSA